MIQRSYHSVLRQRLAEERQMVFVCGPRQVGKTTLCKGLEPDPVYFNWDNADHRLVIMNGADQTAETAGLNRLMAERPLIVFDEIHKYPRWKTFLKGFFDVYSPSVRLCVTGSAKLNLFQKGGDSLMGRYFLYRLHPLSVREITKAALEDTMVQAPRSIPDTDFASLYTFGGYPEPYLKGTKRFSNRWQRLRKQQLLHEEMRDLTGIQEIYQLEHLAEMIIRQSGQLLNYSRMAARIDVSVDTVRRWVRALEALYFCFTITPWTRRINRSLRKQPKIYLWDWAGCPDEGAKAENFVAVHLLKAVHWWTDNGYGNYDLHYIRDKDKREVDFLITRDGNPWMLAEVKTGGGKTISPHLARFQAQTDAPHAFQIAMDMEYIDADCFAGKRPIIVPAKTLLSQLV